jgi:hypothetical protein
MQRTYPLIKGCLLTGGFAVTGTSGFINQHIRAVERVSDTEVRWTVQNEYGEEYLVTVTATIPTVSGVQDKTKRENPQVTITEVVSGT